MSKIGQTGLHIKRMNLSKPAFPAPDHDHGRCAAEAFAHAEGVCAARGQKFTPIRRQVLELVWKGHHPVKAYDLIDALRKRAGANLPAALITGDGSEEVKQAARSRGVVLLTKPVKPASLRAFLAAQRG